MTRDDRFAHDAMDAFDAVWMSGDVAAILELFEPDGVFFGSGDGEQAVGHAEIEGMLASLAPHAEGATFSIEWQALTGEVLGELGLIRGLGRVRASGPLAKFDGTVYRLTGVLVRQGDVWRWKVYHGSEPASW